MHLRHIDPRSLEWKDAMLDETRPGPEPDGEVELAAADTDSRQSMPPPTSPSGLRQSIGLSAPSR